MSETNSLLPQDKTTDETRPADTASNLEASGRALFERLGVGGMGEVYRCGDDALQRDLAIKILKTELHGDESAEERFLREARLTGSLQHPGIVPVHHLGQLADGRPCYTMKLVRGRTFADMIRDEPAGPERLPRLLAVVEKVCQAVAFAHSKGVIHRDLKPSNVMVGEFGEVQVMDWGLAKELRLAEPAPSAEDTEAVETAAWTKEAEGLSRAGLALGTPAYMPPEQAAGDWDIVDERADVFALGAILCEMLTGRPPYHGSNRDDLLRRARRGEMAGALDRLTKCGADAVLVELCRECLEAERLQRPRHAGAVAERLASYQAEVRERLRQAELERARAEVKALEERKRRRLLAVMALMALLLLAGGGGALWWRHLKQDRADQAALAVLDHGRQRLDDGWRLHDLAILREAMAEAERADDIASGGVSAAVEQQVADFRRTTTEQLVRAEKNRNLLDALLDIATPHETKIYQTDESRQRMQEVAELSVEEQYAAAFHRRWPDVDIEKQAESAVAERLQAEPEVVLQGVIAGLDGWMQEERRQKRDEAQWRRLFGLVERLDHSEPRRQLRALLIGAVPPRPEDVAELLGGRAPWIALWKLGQGKDWRHLQQLRGRMDVSTEPVLTVLLLSQVSSEVGHIAGAEQVLRQALARRPDEVALLDALGKVLLRQGSSRLDEAIGCYRAVRARHPGLGLTLGQTLVQRGVLRLPALGVGRAVQTPDQARQAAEGEAILRDLVRQQPKNPEMLVALGNGLESQGKLGEAEAAYHKAIALQPDNANAYRSLVPILGRQGKFAEEEAVYRMFIALKPDEAWGYIGLGGILNQQGKPGEAEVAYRKAIALKPDDARVYYNLARILSRLGKRAEEEAAYRKAIALSPTYSLAYVSLGDTLRDQKKYAEAEEAYRQAIALQPANAWVYANLNRVLKLQGKPTDEEEGLRKPIALKPDNAEAYERLGSLLGMRGRQAEAEAIYRKLIALQPKNANAYMGLGSILNQLGKHAEAEAVYRKYLVLKPDVALGYYNLGVSLRSQGKHAEAEAVYRKTITLWPDDAVAYGSLGMMQSAQGKHAEAEAAYRKAIALMPNDSVSHVRLGDVLRNQKRYAEAEAAYRQAIALHPNSTGAYTNLDNVLKLQGKALESEAAFRKAIALRPGDTEAHNNLASLLNAQGKLAEAEAVYREVIALQPHSFVAYSNLGETLIGQGKHAEAEAAFRKSIELYPPYAVTHNNLGRALYGKGDLDGAIASYKKAIELNPKDAWPHNNLGLVLYDKGDPDGAIPCYKKALELDPQNIKAQHNLGNALRVQGRHAEAEAAYRKIIALNADDTWAYCNLGAALRAQGRFAESLTAYRHGHELGSKQPDGRFSSLQWVRDAERMVELEKKLPAVLQGKAAPANADEAIILTWMCRQPYQKRYAASARLYAAAFALDPKFADDMVQHHRYYAACSAAMAAAGKGEDARLLPDKVAAMFRHWALGWLRDHLAANAKLPEQNKPEENKAIQQRLSYWRRDPDLASVRDPQALDRLPDSERAAWQTLWRDVDQLAKQVRKTDETKP